MLDLSKPLGQIDGIPVFADHEKGNVAYYLPDEIDLRMLAPDRPDISLQIFYPDQATVGGSASLDKAVGSILSLGVQCRLSPTREELLRSKVASLLGGTSDLRLGPPPWEDGSVDLLLLDSQSGETLASAVKDDRMVRGVVGSRRPSLSDGLLSGIFHARLDRRGTALVAAAINGEVGSLAGVLYDLKFSALRPTVDLRMSANLDRCAEVFRAGVGVQVYYVSADISATFAKMREQGIIKVDLVSQAPDPETERMANEAVKDFYDVLMRELFKPTVPPAEALAGMGVGSAPQTSIVKFSFSYTRTQQERVIEVDYRKRSATRRIHNPQAHLSRLATLGGGRERVIQRVPLSAAWREFDVEIAAPGAFDQASLRQVQAVIWRGGDPVLPPERARDGGLRMPATTAPIADIAFSKTDNAARRLSWAMMPDEPPFYRWQARLVYAQEDDVDSPAEIWSEPHVSSSADLDLFPEILAPHHQTTLRWGAGHPESTQSVEAQLIARDPQGQKLAERRLSVSATRAEAKWSVRRGEQQRVTTDATVVYRYAGGASLTRPPQRLLDRDLFINTPFIKTVTVTPVVAGAPPDVVQVALTATYENQASGYRAEQRIALVPPDFRATDIKVPVIGSADVVRWEAVAVRANGETVPLGRGDSAGGFVPLRFSTTRNIRVEWLGPTPADLGLKWLRATFRNKLADGQIGESVTLEWRGNAVDGQRIVTLPATGRAEWSVERRFEDGRKEVIPFTLVDGDLVPVSG